MLAHYQWLLHYRCVLHQVHNATTCQEVLGFLGPCVEAIELAFELPSVTNSVTAQNICLGQLSSGSTNGILIEDIRKRVSPSLIDYYRMDLYSRRPKCDSDDLSVCYPEYLWANDLFNGPQGKRIFRVPEGVEFAGLENPVSGEFVAAGDMSVHLIPVRERSMTSLGSACSRIIYYTSPFFGMEYVSYVSFSILEPKILN